MTTPILVEVLKVKRCNISNNTVCAAIDKGQSLIKIVYIDSNKNEENSDVITLQCALFHGKDFKNAVIWLAEQQTFPTHCVIHVTGHNVKQMSDFIEKTLNIRTETLNKMFCRISGIKFLVDNCVNLEEICYPSTFLNEINVDANGAFEVFQSHMRNSIHKNEGPNFFQLTFPAICAFLSSSFHSAKIENNLKTQFGTINHFGGQAFLSLAKQLVGTDIYDEVMDLAAKGNRSNVDTVVREILVDDPNSPYGSWPQDMPMFFFGKCVDQNKSANQFSKEDLACSLVGQVAMNLAAAMISNFRRFGISRCYIAGSFARASVIREQYFFLHRIYGVDQNNTMFLKTAHYAAVGAMISTKKDEEKFEKFNNNNLSS